MAHCLSVVFFCHHLTSKQRFLSIPLAPWKLLKLTCSTASELDFKVWKSGQNMFASIAFSTLPYGVIFLALVWIRYWQHRLSNAWICFEFVVLWTENNGHIHCICNWHLLMHTCNLLPVSGSNRYIFTEGHVLYGDRSFFNFDTLSKFTQFSCILKSISS